MKLTRCVVSITVVCLSVTASAFSKDHCAKLFPTSDGDHPPYYSPIYVSTMFPSTTSYFSSFGPCSMYGDGVGSRIAFVESEISSLRVEAARGTGDRIEAFASLTGCPSDTYIEFGHVMKNHYESIFTNIPEDSLDFLKRVDSALRTDMTLKRSCLQLSSQS